MITSQKKVNLTIKEKKVYKSIALDYAFSALSSSEISYNYGYSANDTTIIHKACHLAIELLLVDDLAAEKIFDRAYRSSIAYRSKVEDSYTISFEIREKNRIKIEECNLKINKIKKKLVLYKSFLDSKNSCKHELEETIGNLRLELKELIQQKEKIAWKKGAGEKFHPALFIFSTFWHIYY